MNVSMQMSICVKLNELDLYFNQGECLVSFTTLVFGGKTFTLHNNVSRLT